MERIALALGARGLVNAQFIVRDDGVYLIEVNPRASRTVPFMSKVTGVPMVELAVRIALGATLAELGWPRRPAAAAAVRRGQGAGVLDGQAARASTRRSGRHAVDRRGHRHPRRRARRAGQGAAGRRADPAARRARTARRSRCSRSPTATSARLPRLAAALGRRRLPARRDAPGRAAPCGGRPRGASPSRSWARKPTPRGEVGDPRAHRRRARSGSSSTRRRRARARSATPPRSATRRSPRASCASPRSRPPSPPPRRSTRTIADEIAEVRPITDWVPMVTGSVGAGARA